MLIKLYDAIWRHSTTIRLLFSSKLKWYLTYANTDHLSILVKYRAIGIESVLWWLMIWFLWGQRKPQFWPRPKYKSRSFQPLIQSSGVIHEMRLSIPLETGCYFANFHYSDVIMGVMASQFTSLTIVYPTVYSGADLIKENIKAPRHWPLSGEFTGDRWIPRTNGQ